jgi:hypothetical protein
MRSQLYEVSERSQEDIYGDGPFENTVPGGENEPILCFDADVHFGDDLLEFLHHLLGGLKYRQGYNQDYVHTRRFEPHLAGIRCRIQVCLKGGVIVVGIIVDIGIDIHGECFCGRCG